MMTDLSPYLYRLTHLNRAPTRYGKAPHKPVLLITLLELIDKGIVTDNQFPPDTELVGIFQENWRLLVATAHQADFTQPYYYLQSEKVGGEPLWQLIPQPGCQINAHIKSVNTLIQVVSHGAFTPELALYLQNPEQRQQILQLLLATYFPATAAHYQAAKQQGEGFYHQLEDYLLNKPEVRTKLIRIETEEEVFIRSGLFKRLVPQVYHHTCSITGMQLGSTFGHSFIDACHIVPFSVSQDDRVINGIALCPNLHRAFDRGLVSIDQNYQVLLSNHIRENSDHSYSLRALSGQSIRLPPNRYAWPSQEMLEWHRIHCFKG